MNTLLRIALLSMVWLIAPVVADAQSPASPLDSDAAAALVTRIRRADYEGDRTALQRLYQELKPLAAKTPLSSRVHYWLGFALWRRTINGFNDAADPTELEQDLHGAIREFEEAARLDPSFVDANVGAISCMGNLVFLHRNEPARVQELVPPMVKLLKDTLAVAPDNPRLLWVQGPMLWYAPPGMTSEQVEERRARALAGYERGVQLAHQQLETAKDPLEPSWGEPELLMNLAWSNLNRPTPDIPAAEDYARRALALVPYWHYVRDILMPQIQTAKGKH